MNVLAVVIGNNQYPDPDKLTNAVNDAKAIEKVFVRLGYKVISSYDCDNKAYDQILRDFENELPNYDASIFFYAGHGFQEDGENYLPSIECQIQFADKRSLERNSIRLAELLVIYKNYSRKSHIVILDACRKRTGQRGEYDSFAPVNAPYGTLIAFSTSPNCGADDTNGGEHSIYTKALLSYIGREKLMVEDLFKKVRRSVVQWTNNKQVPWEHTSLIGDFCFNTGQMIASPQIPYKENVVKDADFNETGEIADLIREIRVLDYNRQNPAINKLRSKNASDLDKNQQFIFGRNLLQSSEWSFRAQDFLNSPVVNLRKYSTSEGENHVLNGILFEIYFGSHGEFREMKIKRNLFFDKILALRNSAEFEKSFDFIRNALSPYYEDLIYTIPSDDAKLDVNLSVREEKIENSIGEENLYSIISSINVNGSDITFKVKQKFQGNNLKEAVAIATNAPEDAVELHSNIPLKKHVMFENDEDDDFLNL